MISVLTVHYRAADDLAGLADSLVAAGGDEPVELIVVDHSPEQPARPAAGWPPTRVIAQKNLGFAAGVNRAAAAAHGDLLFVANPDVRVMPGALGAARRFLDERADVGVMLPLLRDPGGAVQFSVRRFYTWPVALWARSPMRMLGWEPAFFRAYLGADLPRTEPIDVDWGLGGAMFLRAADFPRGEIFDSRFFLYFEDVDLCLRQWRAGRRVVYVPQVVCTHAHRRGSRSLASRHAWHHLCSLFKFVCKHRGLPQRPRTS